MLVQTPPVSAVSGLHAGPSVEALPQPDPFSVRTAEAGQRRLVIVSNRVADLRSSQQTGGLAVGLADALRKRGGIWFGWNGAREGETGGPVEARQTGNVTTLGAPVSPEDFSAYYLGYANSVLWPLLHYRLDLVDYSAASFEAYLRVNEAFARQLMPFLKPDDVIWVHDYHLIPLAACLRKLGCRQRIGFFLHIPFPPPDLLTASPDHPQLVDALVDYDLAGFQTHTDVSNLKTYLRTRTSAQELPGGRFRLGARNVQIRRFPIGIDARGFAELARREDTDPAITRMRRRLGGRQQIIGVDRLDYSKGLPGRFKAFEALLSQHPELAGAVTFLQIAPPTREGVGAYADIRDELERLAGSVNGRFASFDWTPLHYIHRPVPRNTLAPLLRLSKVGFVTPLRDGMNLVAKEYVAAQDPDDPGVLILSQFAGAAEEMREALIVNPYDVDAMAQQLHRALTMSLDERRTRHAALLAHVTTATARGWLEGFLATLTADLGEGAVRLAGGGSGALPDTPTLEGIREWLRASPDNLGGASWHD
ncbi:alpha,alpha-trehalose-phosphate synthase (UDP-forming) [Pararhodobacter sp.]|uniref:alpha,alpha-trehalose-phosphate synthase (UDP-forming) n=1 Tax=Pararhodobacter sp. TaxID=2127056 RepID=UPI002FDDB13B